MRFPDSPHRFAAVCVVAAVSRELSLLPQSSADASGLVWLWTVIVNVLTSVTAEIGLIFSYLFAPLSYHSVPDLKDEALERKITLAPVISPKSGSSWERTVADRKLNLLRRSGLFGADTKGAAVERATTLGDLRKAYKLVHDVYLGTGFIEPEPAGMRLRIFETSPDMATFIAKVSGRVVGVLSIVSDSKELGLPSDAVFKKELDALRATGARLCEATNQAVAEEYRNSAVPTELMRCAVAHFTQAGFHQTIATVSPSHNSFYELLGFRSIGSERSYSEKIHDPVIALGMDVNQYRRAYKGTCAAERFVHRFLAAENQYLSQVAKWARQAKREFLSADLLHSLFITERNFVAECSPSEVRILHRRWGRKLFGAVAGNLFLPSCNTPPVARNREGKGTFKHRRCFRPGLVMRKIDKFRSARAQRSLTSFQSVRS